MRIVRAGRGAGELAGSMLIHVVLAGVAIATLYPFWHVVMYSLSNPKEAMDGGLFLFPRGFSLMTLRMLARSRGLVNAYGNTVWRTAVGGVVNVLMTASLAYPLSLPRFRLRNLLTMLIFFTMLFGGGLVPTYLLVNGLGLIDSRWALILPGMISAYNMFIMRNYFKSIPASLEESARIDGAGPALLLARIILPVSKPVIAAIALFYGVWHWNAYFDAIIYINTPRKMVLQVFLRSMLSVYSMQQVPGMADLNQNISEITEESVRMATVALSVLPMLVVYPFIQKYYVRGIMIGSIKG